MKKLKKTVCVLLAMLLLCGIFAVQVSAQTEQQPDMDALLETFKGYLDEHNIDYVFEGEGAEFVKFIIYSNEWAVFYCSVGGDPIPKSDHIGNYVFMSSSWERPYELGLYAEKDGVILTLKEAYDTGKIDIQSVAQADSPYINAYPVGDTDMDGVVAVNDVLNVQKAVAKQIGVSELFEFVFYDYDGNGEITIKDVLAMQKTIAKIA